MKNKDFITGKVPITKEEVRAISLNKLELLNAKTFIDVGAGTGSVSIEAGYSYPNLKVIAIERNDDAIDFMKRELKYKRNKSTFVYIDPPYYKEGPGLYRYFYSEKQHKELANYIKMKRFPWLLSYDDTPEIRRLYNRKTCINLYLDYSVKTSKKGKEILISDLEIPPMEQENILVG